MLPRGGLPRTRTTILLAMAIIKMMAVLSAMLSGCLLDRWLTLEPGVYTPLPNDEAAGFVKSLSVDRDNKQATINLADSTRVVVSFSSRDRSDWPSGCPANIGSTYMEVLDIMEGALKIGLLTFNDPILVRDCPSEPERIILREDGQVGGGGACAGLDRCLNFRGQSQAAPELTAPIVSAKPLPPSMKGYELYSWYDEQEEIWRYTLITGTNRLKTVKEITAEENLVTRSKWVKITATGTESLKALLRRLPSGTYLFWQGGDRLESDPATTAHFTLPDSSLVRTIQDLCRQLEIHLTYSVLSSPDGFLIQELPVYVP